MNVRPDGGGRHHTKVHVRVESCATDRGHEGAVGYRRRSRSGHCGESGNAVSLRNQAQGTRSRDRLGAVFRTELA